MSPQDENATADYEFTLNGKDYPIASLLPITRENGRTSMIGLQYFECLQCVLKQINQRHHLLDEKRLKVLVSDTGLTSSSSLASVYELCEKDPLVTIGPSLHNQAEKISYILGDKGLPLFEQLRLRLDEVDGNLNIVTSYPSLITEAGALIDFVKALGFKNIAFLTADSPSGLELTERVQKECKNYGINLKCFPFYIASYKEMKPFMDCIIDDREQIDLVIIWSAYTATKEILETLSTRNYKYDFSILINSLISINFEADENMSKFLNSSYEMKLHTENFKFIDDCLLKCTPERLANLDQLLDENIETDFDYKQAYEQVWQDYFFCTPRQIAPPNSSMKLCPPLNLRNPTSFKCICTGEETLSKKLTTVYPFQSTKNIALYLDALWHTAFSLRALDKKISGKTIRTSQIMRALRTTISRGPMLQTGKIMFESSRSPFRSKFRYNLYQYQNSSPKAVGIRDRDRKTFLLKEAIIHLPKNHNWQRNLYTTFPSGIESIGAPNIIEHRSILLVWIISLLLLIMISILLMRIVYTYIGHLSCYLIDSKIENDSGSTLNEEKTIAKYNFKANPKCGCLKFRNIIEYVYATGFTWNVNYILSHILVLFSCVLWPIFPLGKISCNIKAIPMLAGFIMYTGCLVYKFRKFMIRTTLLRQTTLIYLFITLFIDVEKAPKLIQNILNNVKDVRSISAFMSSIFGMVPVVLAVKILIGSGSLIQKMNLECSTHNQLKFYEACSSPYFVEFEKHISWFKMAIVILQTMAAGVFLMSMRLGLMKKVFEARVLFMSSLNCLVIFGIANFVNSNLNGCQTKSHTAFIVRTQAMNFGVLVSISILLWGGMIYRPKSTFKKLSVFRK